MFPYMPSNPSHSVPATGSASLSIPVPPQSATGDDLQSQATPFQPHIPAEDGDIPAEDGVLLLGQ